MKYMTGKEIAAAFLKFYEDRGHLVMPSASLIPENDPTLLMIGAGMAPLKPFFTGKLKPPCPRVTTNQRCVRTGDIENVGRTARHHTAFMMLGNFSFGDYFKSEAIPWAWEFLTEVCELPREKLWVSIYSNDDEAEQIWLKQPGLNPEHIVRLEDNFWEIGPGPCGPDSEIYIDLGEERGCGKETCAPGCDCERFLELHNLVFTQFDKNEDNSYKPLDHKNIDTGMGLERLASVLQEKKSNFETDLLFPIIEYVEKICGLKYGSDAAKDVSMKVIADHARSMAFMIMDKILPSNEGRGYVLRRILRRAIRHGRMLGIKGAFLEGAIDVVAKIYGDMPDFDELARNVGYIKKVVRLEEDRFAATLAQGMEVLTREIDSAKSAGKSELDGEICFKLYDTFGFPFELTEEILAENNLSPDKAGFDSAMQAQRQRARTARAANERLDVPDLLNVDTEHLTHDENCTASKIFAIWKDGKLVDELHDGEEAGIILECTPFYAEGGGQVGDEGFFFGELGKIKISNAKKLPDGTIYHEAYVEEGQVKVGDKVQIQIDRDKKLSSARNHTATHLLQAALKKVVGSQVNQAGSLVTPERLRFDFTNLEPVTAQQLADVEELVNEEILKAVDVTIRQMPIAEAKKLGAMALFGEKYGDIVRVVNVEDFSCELCGGSHVSNVGQIGRFKIVSEGGIAAGVRRIEAVTGEGAITTVHADSDRLSEVAHLLKGDSNNLADKVRSVLERTRQLEKELQQLKEQAAAQESANLSSKAIDVNGVKLLVSELSGVEPKMLRTMVDDLKNQLGSTIIVLATVAEGKVSLIAGVSKDVTDRVKAGELIGMVAQQVGGKGGGRPDMAQAGGTDAAALPAALASVKGWVSAKLQ